MAGGYSTPPRGLDALNAKLDNLQRQIDSIRSGSRLRSAVLDTPDAITLRGLGSILAVDEDGAPMARLGGLSGGGVGIETSVNGQWVSYEDAVAGSDGLPPQTAPEVDGGPFAVGGVEFSWEPVENADPVTYEVALSLTSPVDTAYYDPAPGPTPDPEADPDVEPVVTPPVDGEDVPPLEPNLDVVLVPATDPIVRVNRFKSDLLEADAPVYVRVRAVDADGPGPWSDEVSASPRVVDFDLVSENIRQSIEAADQKAVDAQAGLDQALLDLLAVTQLAQSAQNAADDAIRTWYQENAPADLNDTTDLGDLWYQESTGIAYRWAGSGNGGWTLVRDNAIAQALAAAQTAQAAADAAQAEAEARATPASVAAAELAAKNAAALDATAKADAARAAAVATAATDATNKANARGKVIFSSTAPPAADRQAQNLWIDTTPIGSPALPGNVPKRWTTGTTWVAVTDKAVIDAAAAAAAAKTAADSAAQLATQAMTTANGKNKNTAGPAADPSQTDRVEGDLHFVRTDGEVTRIQRLIDDEWVDEPINVQVLAGLDAAFINTILLSADTILSRLLAAEEVTAEMVAADFLAVRQAEIIDLFVSRLRSEINEVGDSMVFDGPHSTITVWKDSTRDEVLFQVGPEGAINRVPMDTDGISAMGAVILKSDQSRVDPGGALTFSAGGVPDPSMEPLLGTGRRPVATWPAVPAGFRNRGISWDATDGCWIRLLSSTASDPTGKSRVEKISTTGASLGFVTLGNVVGPGENDMNSIVRVGSSYYVAVYDQKSVSEWMIARFNVADGAFITVSNNTWSGVLGRACVGLLATGEISFLHVFGGANPELRGVYLNPTTLAINAFGTIESNWTGSRDLMGHGELGYGFGFTPAWGEMAVITDAKVHAYNRLFGAVEKQPAYDITLAGGSHSEGGVGFRPGAGWHSIVASSRTLGQYSTYRNPGGQRAYVTYADRNIASGRTTKDSPPASIVIPNHHFVSADLPNPAANTDEQWAYMGLGTSLPTDANLKHRTEPIVGRRIVIDPAAPGGAAVPATNTFTGGSPAVARSESAVGWALYGNGRVEVSRDPVLDTDAVNLRSLKAAYGYRTKSTNQSIPASTFTTVDFNVSESADGILWDSVARAFIIPADGKYVVHASVRFAGSSGGQRILAPVVNGSTATRRASTPPPGSISFSHALSLTIELEEGDLFGIQAWHSVSGGLNVEGTSGYTYVDITRVGS